MGREEIKSFETDLVSTLGLPLKSFVKFRVSTLQLSGLEQKVWCFKCKKSEVKGKGAWSLEETKMADEKNGKKKSTLELFFGPDFKSENSGDGEEGEEVEEGEGEKGGFFGLLGSGNSEKTKTGSMTSNGLRRTNHFGRGTSKGPTRKFEIGKVPDKYRSGD
jgi:hypothetical protein